MMFQRVTDNTSIRISSTVRFIVDSKYTKGVIIELPRKANDFQFLVSYIKVSKTRGDSLHTVFVGREKIRQICIDKKWFLNYLWYD